MPLDAQSPDIDYLMQTPELREKLSGHLKKTYTQENLQFLDAVENLRKTAAIPGAEDEVRKKAKVIQDEFINQGAEQEVNINGGCRTTLQSQIANPKASPQQLVEAFEPASQEVKQLLTDHTRMWLATSPEIGAQIAAERAKHQEAPQQDVAPQNWTKTKPTIREQLKIGSHRVSQEQKQAVDKPSLGGHRPSGVK